jgi:hypothetical protein
MLARPFTDELRHRVPTGVLEQMDLPDDVGKRSSREIYEVAAEARM